MWGQSWILEFYAHNDDCDEVVMQVGTNAFKTRKDDPRASDDSSKYVP